MGSLLNSNSTVVLATAMAVSGTVIVLAIRLQKSIPTLSTTQFTVTHLPRSCISSDERKREKKKSQKKRVHFAEDVVDPTGNGEEFRKRQVQLRNITTANNNNKAREMPANRMALYNGILRDRVVYRPASYSC